MYRQKELSMKIISWNVNGIRAVIKKGFYEFIADQKPDILCIQETKAQPDQVELQLPDYPYVYWNSAERKGYSGTLILSKTEPVAVTNGIGIAEHDTEGRVITAEYKDYYLVTIYVPNSKRGLERLPYRHDSWDPALLKYMKQLEKKKPVIFCGDMNVAHKEIDLANPATNTKNAGFTIEEREGFDNIIAAGFIDSFREYTKDGGHYTWWSYMRQARDRNIGWRIDYFGISPAIKPVMQDSYILPDVMGSDHCPVVLQLKK